jgi:hypothetical protein
LVLVVEGVVVAALADSITRPSSSSTRKRAR